MMPMRRQPAPAAWADKERNYLAKRDKLSAKAALHDWQHESQIAFIKGQKALTP